MPLPGDINTIVLTGTYLDVDGNPRSGTVTFTPATAPLADTTGKVILAGVPVAAGLSTSGTFSITLPCTDQLTPSGWAYTVTELISGTQTRIYAIQLPHTLGSTVDISTLTPVAPVPSVSPYLLVSQLGTANGPALLNGSAVLPVSEGGTGASTVSAGLSALGGLPVAGGTMTGPLAVTATGSSGVITPLPYGYGDSDAPTGVVLESSYPSDDVSGGTDGTARINLYSYQRANAYSFGETIRNFLMRWDAKAMTAWYGPTGGSSGALTAAYDGSGNATGSNFKPWTWVGSHYEANDHASIHGHWEVEVPDSTGALQGRFCVLFANTTTGAIGLDTTTINTNLANFHVYCHGNDHTGAYVQQYFRLTGSLQKAIEWNNDNAGGSAGRRWKLASTETAETGGNAGSDFYLYRYDDTGNLIDNPIEVIRSTGKVQIGGNNGTANGLAVNSASGVGITVNVTNTGGQAYLAIGADATARAMQGEVAGDTTVRHVTYVDGKHEWGDGTDARDTNLYRSGANLLKTDDSFEAAAIAVGASPGSLSLSITGSASGQLAQFTRTSTSDTSPVVLVLAGDTSTAQAIGVSVSGDSVSRFGIDPTGKLTWGDGTDARDVDLYRASAGVLKTDESLTVQGTLGIGQGAGASIKFQVSNSATGQLAQFTRTSTSDSSPVVLVLAGDTTTSSALALSVNGDAVNRFAVDPAGSMSWGSGSAARDVTLFRAAAGVLETAGTLHAGTNFRLNTTSLGGGSGVLAMANASVVPASNPTGGGVLYASGGHLYWLGSSGSAVELA